ncbi:uncharacterized protein LOC125490066 [Plutella xylostella]|uniref:uncharacterized protein LOC125490066 n=1 Tax=Plutella xylostella TaxID=51655 RepID=UPI00203272FB|nr:uncharacterized protein LOC125490066 [Plutella xylostella]
MSQELDFGTLFKFVKPYDGNRETLNSFLVNCDNAINLASDQQKPILFKFILSQLNGKAEVACSIKDFNSWDQLKEFLKTQFSERKHYSHLLTDLQESRQGPQENQKTNDTFCRYCKASDHDISMFEPMDSVTILSTSRTQSTSERTEKVVNALTIDHLNLEEKEALIELCSMYSDIFYLPEDHLTFTSALDHQIKTNSDIPIHTKSYRFPECHKKEVESQIGKMLDQNIIEPSSSPWSSPIWIVPKKLDSQGQRKWRIVIDYRKLNDITIGETYPIPQISEILDQLGNSKYFSTLDLTSGFHQILINKADAPKTAFSVPQGHFQFNRMPFGLKNAPSTFQKLMNTCLSGLQGTRCFVYLDDIVVYSHDLNSHINNLKSVFERLRNFNLKLQPGKCEFLRTEVAYLGHIIGEHGVKPNPEKIKAVSEYPIPNSPKDIKSFLGLVSYYRRFIPDFSKLAKPLTSLLKKDVPFKWQNDQQLAFESLKTKLISAPILAYPDFTQPFLLTCDASNYAISAILSQGPIGQDRPIAYASRTLNKAECNYSVTEKECLAVIYGTKVFRPYLYGNSFTVITDHKPLEWLFKCKDPGSRLIRWRLKLEEFEYDIRYKKGKINTNADALSRFPVNPVQPEQPLESGSNENQDPVLGDIDLMDLLTSPPSFNLDDLSPLNLGEDLVPLPEINPEPYLPSTADPPDDIPTIEVNPPSVGADDQPIVMPTPSPTNNQSDLPDHPYSTFLKSIANKDIQLNTKIIEHNEKITKAKQKIIVIPTSIDLDESNPFIQEILGIIPDPEILNKERVLNSFISFENENKLYYLLFFKVHHFDKSCYEDIYKCLKSLRNEFSNSANESPISEIAITDFKNPFDVHQFIKIYNMYLYLFHNMGIDINIYKDKIIYPALSEIPKILRENHEIPIAGHLGSTRMLRRIQEKFYWKNMRGDIENYVKKCPQCQTNKALRQINRAPMQITSSSTEPCQRISLDIVGPLPEAGPAKLKYILTIQDDLTKFSSAYPIRSTTAEETSECLLHYISIFGIPKTILTDQGTNFTSELFKKTCEFLKIKNLWSSPYHPQTQGALERSHSTLKEYLRSFVNEEQTNWPRYVYTAMLTYNTTVHSTTHFSPFELLFGCKPSLPNSIYEDCTGATYPDYVRMLQNRLKYSREKALDLMRKSKESSKTYYDTHTRPVKYKTGDYVYLKNHLRMRKGLSPQWKGPYKVIKINGNNTLTLLINRRHVKHHYDEVKLANVELNL